MAPRNRRRRNWGRTKARKPTRKQQMQNAARARHAKFKQTRVQTFGGKKTKFSKSEQKRITNAGYSVSGYSKAAPRSNTSVQISKDNARYGNTVPAGSFGISKAGKIQAKANKLAKIQPKKDAYNFSKGVSNLSASFTSPAVQNWAGTSFDKASSWYNKGRLPNEGKMSIRNLLRNDLSQQQQIGKFNPNRKLNWASYARGESNPFRGMPGYGTITGQGQVEGGFQTGPTPSVRQAIERPLKAAMNIGKFVVNPKVAILGSLLKPTPLADGTLRGKPGFEMQAGGLNIGGGSNISSGSDAVRNSRTARKLSSISNRSKRNQNLLASAEGWGLRPDGVTGAYKEGQIFNTGGKSGADYIYKGTPGKGSFVPLATTPPVPLATASPDASSAQGYINQLSIYGMNPNYMPQFQFSRRGQAVGRAYRNAWNRNNFRTTV